MEPFPAMQGEKRQQTDVRNYSQGSSDSSTCMALCALVHAYLHIRRPMFLPRLERPSGFI